MNNDNIQSCMNEILNECEDGSMRHTAVQSAMRILENSNKRHVYNDAILFFTDALNVGSFACCAVSLASLINAAVSMEPFGVLVSVVSCGIGYAFTKISRYLMDYA